MSKRILIAGYKGMVGSAITRLLSKKKDNTLILVSRNQLDLLDKDSVEKFIKKEKPDQVYFAAAKVGGIYANNKYPADFISDNIIIQSNVIHGSFLAGVQKLLFLGSSCIYPQLAKQPINEDSLLTGKLEPTNEPYAIAKIAGIKMCESYNRQYDLDYRCVMPTNLYGKYDNFHPKNSHVIPAMMLRFHQAKIHSQEKVKVWGSGKPMREFLYVDDMASACIHVMNLPKDDLLLKIPNQMCSHINIGTGCDITIDELAKTMAKVVGFKGDIEFDSSKPDGTPRKLLDVSRINLLGWRHSVDLDTGLRETYSWFSKNIDNLRKIEH